MGARRETDVARAWGGLHAMNIEVSAYYSVNGWWRWTVRLNGACVGSVGYVCCDRPVRTEDAARLAASDAAYRMLTGRNARPAGRRPATGRKL